MRKRNGTNIRPFALSAPVSDVERIELVLFFFHHCVLTRISVLQSNIGSVKRLDELAEDLPLYRKTMDIERSGREPAEECRTIPLKIYVDSD